MECVTRTITIHIRAITCEKRSATNACIGNSSSVATGINSLKNMKAISARQEQYSSASLQFAIDTSANAVSRACNERTRFNVGYQYPVSS
jgi:hypothetical protein